MMAESTVRLTESERLALDFLVAALKEGDEDTASLAYDPQEAAFISGIFRVVGKTINVTRRICPVVIQTARLATNLAGGGRAGLSDPRIAGELNQLRDDRSLVNLLEALREGGGQRGFSGGQRGFSGTVSNLSQLSTQELFEELKRRTSR
jgi:hypothetical protein